MSSGRLPVLIYHHVGPLRAGTPRSLTVLPDRFREQMAWLARHGFQPVTLARTIAWWAGESELPSRAVAITFDDGYADLAEWAFPVLAAHDFPSTVFVVSAHLGETNSWDEANGSAAHRLLDASQLQAWRASVDVAGHSRTHASLGGLPPEQVEREIVGSKEDLEAVTNRPVRAFAYPYGAMTEVAKTIASRHFDIAFGVRQGLNAPTTDRFDIRRTMVQHNETWLDLLLRVRTGRSRLHEGRVACGAIRCRARRRHPRAGRDASTRS
jgi:peptidoglycan/xylan/chitin deacetylase (PgdA/CDA1 family)